MTLLFGSRFKKLDYLYEEEINAWLADGLLENAFEAFSRD
jgi:sulfite reductase alpha subunit-like flavoprotein